MVTVDMLRKYYGTVSLFQFPAFVHNPHDKAAFQDKEDFAVVMEVLGKFQVH